MYLFTSINCLSVSPWVFALERERERERAMLQSYSFVLPLKSSVQDQGSATQIQLPVRQIQSIAYNHSFKKRFRCRYFRYFSNSDLNATRIESKTTTEFLESFSEDEFPSITQEDDHPGTIQSDICRQLNAFYRFSRPHTVIGTLIGITSVSLLPLESTADFSIQFFVGLLKALVPSVLMNIYVVGLNQLFDVGIDKVNKPYLPLASGEFSMELGIAIVSTFLLMSFTLGIMFQSPPLLCALIVSFIMGSAYSVELPLLRWKRNAFLAATCILIVRAIVVQLAFFIHIQKYVLDRPIVLSRSLAFAVAFMCLFSTIIALFKDIPDVDGDRDYGIQSFSVSLGQKKVFWLCISMLLIGYGSAMVIGASSSYLSSKLVTVLGHCALASSLWLRARSVDLDSKASITSLYMFIWKLFYAEYLLIPFVR